jgi:hypothetical protein
MGLTTIKKFGGFHIDQFINEELVAWRICRQEYVLALVYFDLSTTTPSIDVFWNMVNLRNQSIDKRNLRVFGEQLKDLIDHYKFSYGITKDVPISHFSCEPGFPQL